jgi:hypothetical protein
MTRIVLKRTCDNQRRLSVVTVVRGPVDLDANALERLQGVARLHGAWSQSVVEHHPTLQHRIGRVSVLDLAAKCVREALQLLIMHRDQA